MSTLFPLKSMDSDLHTRVALYKTRERIIKTLVLLNILVMALVIRFLLRLNLNSGLSDIWPLFLLAGLFVSLGGFILYLSAHWARCVACQARFLSIWSRNLVIQDLFPDYCPSCNAP